MHENRWDGGHRKRGNGSIMIYTVRDRPSSKEQRAGEFPVWKTSLKNPDFAKYAEICGALGIKVTSKDQLDEALKRGLAHEGPVLIEVETDPLLI